jgi:2'-5' RNA ligase
LPGLRWVPEEQLHLTLSFLGAEFGLMKVTGFELYASVLTAAGANHGLEMRKEF